MKPDPQDWAEVNKDELGREFDEEYKNATEESGVPNAMGVRSRLKSFFYSKLLEAERAGMLKVAMQIHQRALERREWARGYELDIGEIVKAARESKGAGSV